jgi:hypothetical protein
VLFPQVPIHAPHPSGLVMIPVLYLGNWESLIAKPIGAMAIGRRAPPTCSRCKETGHRSTNKACPGHVSQVLADLVAYAAEEDVTTDDAMEDDDIINDVIIIASSNTSSAIPLFDSLEYNDPRAIHQRYMDAREACFQTQPSSITKSDSGYRMALGLPESYSDTSFKWCRNFKQMGKQCIDNGRTRPWTEEEMMAYLDWNWAEDDRVDASLIADPLDPSRRGPGEVLRRAEEDAREQQLLHSRM